MNQREPTRDMFRLVGLQMTDEMPFDRQVAGYLLFPQRLLNPVLTNLFQANRVSSFDGRKRMALRHSDDANIRTHTLTILCLSDLLANAREIVWQRLKTHNL